MTSTELSHAKFLIFSRELLADGLRDSCAPELAGESALPSTYSRVQTLPCNLQYIYLVMMELISQRCYLSLGGFCLVALALAGSFNLSGCTVAPSHSSVQPLKPGLDLSGIGSALAYPPFLVDAQRAQRYRQQGLASRQAGQMGVAIATLKLAVALDPYSPQGYVMLGWTQHLAGNQGFAAQTLVRGLEQAPEHLPMLNALGIVYLVDGDLQAAVETHLRALELGEANEIAHYNLSLAYQRLDEFSAAISHAQRATELEPQNPHPWVALALAHWSADQADQAVEAYQQALELDSRYRRQPYLDHLAAAGFSTGQIAMTNAIRIDSLAR